jgi:hypothetical protein
MNRIEVLFCACDMFFSSPASSILAQVFVQTQLQRSNDNALFVEQVFDHLEFVDNVRNFESKF